MSYDYTKVDKKYLQLNAEHSLYYDSFDSLVCILLLSLELICFTCVNDFSLRRTHANRKGGKIIISKNQKWFSRLRARKQQFSKQSFHNTFSSFAGAIRCLKLASPVPIIHELYIKVMSSPFSYITKQNKFINIVEEVSIFLKRVSLSLSRLYAF